MQRANSRNLRNNADEGMKVLEEAARNPVFDQKAIEDFTETLEKMKEVASSKMNLASSKMNEAQASLPPRPRNHSPKLNNSNAKLLANFRKYWLTVRNNSTGSKLLILPNDFER